MELRHILKLIRKKLDQLIIITLLFGFVAGIISFISPDSFQLELFLDIGSTGSQDTSDYKFDNYYRYENSRRLVFSAVQWMEDDGLINTINRNANISSDNFVSVNAEQISDTTLVINWKSKEEDDLKKIPSEIEKALQLKLNTVNDNSDITFTIHQNESVITDGNFPTWLSALAGSFVGLWGTFLWIIVADHLKPKKGLSRSDQ